MKFGIRECANITFRAKQEMKLGLKTFHVGQPVLYIDTATAASNETASSTVYAQGGRGNPRLIAWEGDKTLTFTITDALLSPVSLAMLAGAGLVKESDTGKVHVHATSLATMKITTSGTGTIDLTEALVDFGGLDSAAVDAGEDAPLFIMGVDEDGSLTGDMYQGNIAYEDGVLSLTNMKDSAGAAVTASVNVMVDYYVIKNAAAVSEIQITPNDFAGYYYVEADTLFRRQADGVDLPANLTFPNVKLQSGFTISMAGTGDPSTFDFVMDAFPGYTYFDKTKKVMCVIQIVEDAGEALYEAKSVMPATYSADLVDNTGADVAEVSEDSSLNKPAQG